MTLEHAKHNFYYTKLTKNAATIYLQVECRGDYWRAFIWNGVGQPTPEIAPALEFRAESAEEGKQWAEMEARSRYNLDANDVINWSYVQ